MRPLPQYKASYGLYRVHLSYESFSSELDAIVDDAQKEWPFLNEGHPAENENSSGRLTRAEKYKTIRLLDTFFSDSFPQSVLNALAHNANKFQYKIQILLLDPLSSIARSRAHALDGIDPIEETNKGLNCIRKAMKCKKTSLRHISSHLRDQDYIYKQINDIKGSSHNYRTEVRFYNLLTEAPFYQIHQFAMKGQLKHQVSARENPWLSFVDDPNQDDDIYDFLIDNFNAIWPDSLEYPEGREIYERDTCFVAQDFKNKHTWQAVVNACKDFDLRPVRGDTHPSGKPSERVPEEIRKSAFVIADLTSSNPNVLFEIGLACAMQKRLFIFTRDSPEDAPFDVRDQQIKKYGTPDEDPLEVQLAECFSSIPEMCMRRLKPLFNNAKSNQFNLQHFFNAHIEVVSCQDAALARKISVKEELKSLVLKTSSGLIVLHLCGHAQASYRKVKTFLGVKEARQASHSLLATELLAKPGTICPFTPRIWGLPHLIDEDVLSLEYAYTNNATLTGYIQFTPEILTTKPDNNVGDFKI